MPVYSYVCPVCKFREDHIRTVEKRNEQPPCPICAANAVDPGPEVHLTPPVITMERDMFAEQMTAPPETPYYRPLYSDALGIHPSQINDAKRRFPHHNFTPDGRLILESHKERSKVMKELGFADWN